MWGGGKSIEARERTHAGWKRGSKENPLRTRVQSPASSNETPLLRVSAAVQWYHPLDINLPIYKLSGTSEKHRILGKSGGEYMRKLLS